MAIKISNYTTEYGITIPEGYACITQCAVIKTETMDHITFNVDLYASNLARNKRLKPIKHSFYNNHFSTADRETRPELQAYIWLANRCQNQKSSEFRIFGDCAEI